MSSGSRAASRAQIALHDEGVDADRQVRAVLLDRRDRQHRDVRWPCRRAAKSCQVHSAQNFDSARRLVSSLLSRPATASISTRNSGRAKPATIIRVEAGGGRRHVAVAHRHVAAQMLASGHIGVEADEVRQTPCRPRPGWRAMASKQSAACASTRPPESCRRGAMPSWPEQNTSRVPAGTSMPCA